MAVDGAAGLREEIRLACVFNGGVSLAVWMGGIAHEINEFTSSSSSYGPLLQLLRVQARADVISGTSAGGINGAALALAQVNGATNLADLRLVWGEQGRLETLLNKPFQGHPSSLLRGEEVFLPELTQALHRLATPWVPRPAKQRPIDLTVTTTVLEGVTLQETDSFGQSLNQHRHDVQFRFVRRADGDGGGRDDFCTTGQRRPKGRIIDALGLAARASAGFPVAFEPTLIPVSPEVPAPDRPDMAPYASWGAPWPGADGRYPDRSRYAVDGGLLNNTPTQHALQAIERMPADLAVDRVMMLVIPLPSGPVVETGATVEEPPTLLEMGLGLAASVTSTGSRTFVDDVVKHNQTATSLRATRRDVLAVARTSGADDTTALRETARDLYPHYRRLRLGRHARGLAASVALPPGRSYEEVRTGLDRAQAELDAPRPDGTQPTAVLPMTLVEFVGAPVSGTTWEWGTTPVLDVGAAALEYLARLLEAWPVRDHEPVHTARAGVHQAMAQVRRVRRCLDLVWCDSPQLAPLRQDREYWRFRLAADAWFLRGTAAAREHLTAAAHALGVDAAQTLAPAVAALAREADRGPAATLDGTAGLAGQLLGKAFSAMTKAVVAPTQPTARPTSATVVADVMTNHLAAIVGVLDEPWRPLLFAASAADEAAAAREVAQLLTWLHVASWTIGDELPTENTNPFRFLQVSAATDNHFAGYSTTIQDKLGGASLARFSGFLKRSWRMNDWTWGRFDGSTALLRVLLTPQRVRTLATARRLDQAEQVAALLLEAAWGRPAARAVLDAAWNERSRPTLEAVWGVEALAPADAGADAQNPDLASLVRLVPGAVADVDLALHGGDPREARPAADAPVMRNLAALLAYGRHIRIIHDELPNLAAAVEVDAHEGASPRSRGQLFLAQTVPTRRRLAETAQQEGTVPWLTNGMEALTAFDRSGMGREPLDEEMASDQLIRTAVTAAGVAATVASGKNSGLDVIAPVTRALKGVTMLPYWIARGLTAGGGVARALGLLGLAAGGVLLALALLGVLDGSLAGAVTVLGAGAFVAALTYGALRTGSYLHGTVLAVVAVVLLAAGLSRTEGAWGLGAGIGAVIGATVLVLGLVLLGSLREPMGSPKVFVEDTAVRFVGMLAPRPWVGAHLGAIRAAGLAVTVLTGVVVVVALVESGAGRADRLPVWFSAVNVPIWVPWLRGVVVLVLAAATSALALLARPHLESVSARFAGLAAERWRPSVVRVSTLLLLVLLAVLLGRAVAVLAEPILRDTFLEGLLRTFSSWVATPPAARWLGVVVALAAAAATGAVLAGSTGLRRWQRYDPLPSPEHGTGLWQDLMGEWPLTRVRDWWRGSAADMPQRSPRAWRTRSRGSGWRRERSSGPAGVAAGWSVVYGTAALLAAALALRWWPAAQTPHTAATQQQPGAAAGPAASFWSGLWSVEWVVAGLVLFAVVLMAVAPLLILAKARRRMRDRVVNARSAYAAVNRAAGDRPFVGEAEWLEAHGRAYSAVVRLADDPPRLEMHPGAPGPPSGPEPPAVAPEEQAATT